MKLMIVSAALAAFVWGISSVDSGAATVSCGDFTYQLEASSSGDCFSGNDTGNDGIGLTDILLGKSGWVFSQKIAANGSDNTGSSNQVDGDQAITFSDALVSGEGSGGTGTWSVTDYSSIASDILITIKKQNGFAAFLVDSGVQSGIWQTYKTKNLGDNNIISHSALFYIPGNSTPPDNNTPPAVPLPAAGWMLLAGIGAMAAIRRRKKA